MMTKERVIVSAYTSVWMCDMSLIEEYVQEKLGRPICSNEWGDQRFHEIIQAMVAEDFLMLWSGRISFAKRQRDMVCRCLVE